jgi:hypothetical protein
MLYPPGGRRPEGERHFARAVAVAGHQKRQDGHGSTATQYSGSMSLMTFVMISMLLGVG